MSDPTNTALNLAAQRWDRFLQLARAEANDDLFAAIDDLDTDALRWMVLERSLRDTQRDRLDDPTTETHRAFAAGREDV